MGLASSFSPRPEIPLALPIHMLTITHKGERELIKRAAPASHLFPARFLTNKLTTSKHVWSAACFIRDGMEDTL